MLDLLGKGPLMDLRLVLGFLHAGHLHRAGHVDLGVEVADVGAYRLVLHLPHVLAVMTS